MQRARREPPPRTSRFGSPLVFSRVHWVRPELGAEVIFLTWTDDNLLRQVVYEGLREDKRGREEVSGIGTVLSAGILDVFSGEAVNAADVGCADGQGRRR